MQQVAMVWQLYLLTNSPLSLGLLGAFRVTPILLLALGGGVAADALDRRKLMLASQVGMMLASVGLFAATAAHAVTPAIIYGLAALGGVASAFDAPARQSLLPRLVGAQELPNALSLYTTVYEIAAIAGPALGGAMLAWKGVLPIYALDVVSFVAVAIYGAAIAVFGVSAWFPLSLFALAVSGAADTISMVMRQTLRQMLTPDELRGRMTSVNMMFFIGGPQLGEVEAGVVAKLAGV